MNDDSLNITKKLIYLGMKLSAQKNLDYENKQLYKIYQELKTGKIDYEVALGQAQPIINKVQDLPSLSTEALAMSVSDQFKAETIEQLRIYQYIKENFRLDKVNIQIVDGCTLKITDMTNDKVYLSYRANGEIILKDNLELLE